MRVKAIFEGGEAALTIEHESSQEKAMLEAFGLTSRYLSASAETVSGQYGSTAVRIVVRKAVPPDEVRPVLDAAS
jgi:hypothetical protein